jgi:hypothetical protein
MTYVVVLRSRASAIFYPGDEFTMTYIRETRDPFRLTFRTTYDQAGFDAPLPKDLWVEARGPATNITDAFELFGNAALEISAIIAFVMNASMGALEVELAFDETPEVNEHEFLQSFVADIPITAVPGRRIEIEVLRAFVQAVADHPERKRLQRGIVQYVEALQSWRPGQQINCLAHLYMGVEAVAHAVFREYLRKTGKTEQDVAVDWKVDNVDKRIQRRDLDSEVRIRLVFQGNKECYREAKKVSDAFEHGFSDFDEIRKPAQDVLVKTARCLRQTIIEALGIAPHHREHALGHIPRGPIAPIRYIRGTLLGRSDQLATKDQAYPLMEWRTKLKNVVIKEDGIYGFVPEEKLTAKLGDSVLFRPRSFEVWDGSTIHEQSSDVGQANKPIAIEHVSVQKHEDARYLTAVRQLWWLWVIIGGIAATWLIASNIR